MSKKISEISPGSIVWFNTTLSGSDKSTPFIVLGPSKAGDSILLLQKYVYDPIKKFHSTRVNEYSTSDIDKYLSADATESDSYRSKLSKTIRNCLIKTTIESYSYSSKTTLNLTRDIFLMSYTEAGFTYSNSAVEGNSYLNALKIAVNTTVDNDARKTTLESGDASNWWLRSPSLTGSSPDSYVCCVDRTGIWTGSVATSDNDARPILSVVPATLVDDSTSDLKLLGIFNNIDISISLGQSTNRPIKAKAIVDIQNADSHTIQVTNNYKDANPVWVTVDSNNCAEFTNTTKTTDKWELGIKIQTEAADPNTIVSEPKLIVVTE